MQSPILPNIAVPVADNALLLEPNCMYVCMLIFITYEEVEGQSWDKLVINCFGVWYNLYLTIRGLYHPRLRLGWYSPLIARYKLYHTPKQLITSNNRPLWYFVWWESTSHQKIIPLPFKAWRPKCWNEETNLGRCWLLVCLFEGRLFHGMQRRKTDRLLQLKDQPCLAS